MARISVVVLEKNKRLDGTYPIHIRVFVNGKYAYIDTELSAHRWELEKKKGSKTSSVLSIKDRILFKRADFILRKYEDLLESVNTTNLSASSLRTILISKISQGKQLGNGVNFIQFIDELILSIKSNERTGSAANMTNLRNSLVDYVGRPMLFNYEITTLWLESYSTWLKKERKMLRRNQKKMVEYTVKGVGDSGLYNKLKELRTAFNAMIKQYNNEGSGEIVIKNYPFRDFKLIQPDTLPRGLDAKELLPLYRLFDEYKTLSWREKMALDLFFLSFFMIGINAVDLYKVTKDKLKNGRLIYNRSKVKDRRKDKARTPVKIEPEAELILNKYLSKDGPQLLILSSRYKKSDYLNKALSIGMRALCTRANIADIDFYAARHSWATIARNDCGVSKDDINLALNHKEQSKAMQTTDKYIRPNYSMIDIANRKVIDHFFSEWQEFLKKSSPPPLAAATSHQSQENDSISSE